MDSKIKRILKYLEFENSISIKLFLVLYCNIYSDELFKIDISHKDIKVLLPYLKTISYDYVAKNPNEVYTGDIILVKDSFGNTVPYLKPEQKEYSEVDVSICEENLQYNFEEIMELDDLSISRLVLLSKNYKANNALKEYNKVKKLIKKRKDESHVKEYHRLKEKLLMEGRDEYD